MLKNRLHITLPLAVLITGLAIWYQKTTGPTYPKKVELQMQNQLVTLKLPRSHETTSDAQVSIPLWNNLMSAKLFYRRYPIDTLWMTQAFEASREGTSLQAFLPRQAAAGKLEYYIEVIDQDQPKQMLGTPQEPIMIRFKGVVPALILGPHVLFMFFAMFLSVLAGLEAFFKTRLFFPIALAATSSLALGGLLLGPLVQKNAFGVYWAGFPYDWDLTDNKLLIAFIFWMIALAAQWRKSRPRFVMLAAVVLVGVYSIPHSLHGSQYNYQTQTVEINR